MMHGTTNIKDMAVEDSGCGQWHWKWRTAQHKERTLYSETGSNLRKW